MLQSTDESDSILMSCGDGDDDWDSYLYYSDDDVDDEEGEGQGMDERKNDSAPKSRKVDENIVDNYIDSGERIDAAELFPVRSAQSDAEADASGIKIQVRRNSFS